MEAKNSEVIIVDKNRNKHRINANDIGYIYPTVNNKFRIVMSGDCEVSEYTDIVLIHWLDEENKLLFQRMDK